MRICMWHGWLLDGSGSNVYTAKTAEAMREMGHDVLVVCQEPHPENLPWVDAWAGVDHGVGPLLHNGHAPAASGGRVVMLRPQIGPLLPVFVVDEYEGFEVKTFLDLSESELETYLEVNATALKAAVDWHGSEAVIIGHAIPGGEIGRRALGEGGYLAKVHGSDLVYAITQQERYATLAREGLSAARLVAGASDDVLERAAEYAPEIRGRTVVVHPGVDIERFRLREPDAGLELAAALVQGDPDTSRGRPSSLGEKVREALAQRDADALASLAGHYDQAVPDVDAAKVLAGLVGFDGPIVGYIGKLIPPKGVERMIEGLAISGTAATGLVIGFGSGREWLEALVTALDDGDVAAYRWLREVSGLQLELSDEEVAAATGLRSWIQFTGKLDHRYAPQVLADVDVLVVPSTEKESFGMVTAEGAAAGALPLAARHSGLAEVAAALESHVGRPDLFSFTPGQGATHRVAKGIGQLLSDPNKAQLRDQISQYVSDNWSWRSTAETLVSASASTFPK